MAIDLIHHIYIAAPAERIYEAITTTDGIKSWWTTDVTMTDSRDGGNSPDWIGTTQEFKLKPQADGEVLLKFYHAGWKSGGDHRYFCNTTWGHLLVTLKTFAETGKKDPYFA